MKITKSPVLSCIVQGDNDYGSEFRLVLQLNICGQWIRRVHITLRGVFRVKFNADETSLEAGKS